jgi:hypothetical protein
MKNTMPKRLTNEHRLLVAPADFGYELEYRFSDFDGDAQKNNTKQKDSGTTNAFFKTQIY